MKTGKKKTIVLTLIFCMVVCAGFLTYRPQKEVVLEFGMFAGSNWNVANMDSYIIIDKAIEKFEKEHPGVTVHYYSGIPKEDYSEWLVRKTLKGETPDVYMVLSDDFDRLVSLGMLKNLGDYMKKDDDFEEEAYFKTTLDFGKKDDMQYALPYETVPTLMFANKTLLNKEGFNVPENDWTWKQLEQICERVTKDTNGDGRPDQFGTYNYDWIEAAYTNGGTIFDANGTQCNIDSKEVSEAIRFAQTLNAYNKGEKVTQEDFDNGQVAFMPLSFAEYRTYKAYPYKIKKYDTFQWDCITLPAGPEGKNTSEVSSLLMGINEKTKHAELAWEFLKMLTYDEEVQMNIFRHSQGASVLKNVTNSEEAELILKHDMETDAKIIDRGLLSSVIDDGMIRPRFTKYDDALALAEGEVLKINAGDMNMESSLKIARRTIEHFLIQ